MTRASTFRSYTVYTWLKLRNVAVGRQLSYVEGTLYFTQGFQEILPRDLPAVAMPFIIFSDLTVLLLLSTLLSDNPQVTV